MNHDTILLRCVDTLKVRNIIEEVHEGFYTMHSNGHAMARTILRVDYFWLIMESDCINHVRKCHKFQIYVDKIHTIPTSLNVLLAPWLLSKCGFNVIGSIEPKDSNGY